ncbi:Transcriptional regulator, GntR family [Acidipropionibacterium acidipropionici ATCC 4875]|jgi:DNA-binding transcriptional regulator YhcF (GntR family)|uniref:Transcriptional regulator, GntR family n=1 Tax=Acidipropionibacterium acidipropionici (strain ATCC 4875 / DSM 20272 / JCM 6432 / NBRC 12425 / NCIMB 8070 / 4) TaxID=1171373 RepID=K7RL05_ACIA4|nr:GntR family transcriptional regulator [Acidipropionibacterium acidipropionici]AFV88604.1 Transcriptional regulator, GntR family [Acidipropionibacterium acidipropionici ATCC 4875]ALN14063.1 GntR family transcriptional regulator [Acidipropionibacterium acidipropionici]APZ10175.1 GntR family transcriptional regulator [Acidipropionibacterium acidipropionici]MDN6556402.1 GntR family transcriptional regulator [Acidipropionibacterium acidipropionici]QCV95842.1 GntR family transcriptional regulator
MADDRQPLFRQIAEQVEDSIIDGTLAEGDRAPSKNELAAFHHINPATAANGVNMLVDKGVLAKRRGLGMFVTPGARQQLLDERRQSFAAHYVQPLMTEAVKLGLTPGQVRSMIDDVAAEHPELSTPELVKEES